MLNPHVHPVFSGGIMESVEYVHAELIYAIG